MKKLLRGVLYTLLAIWTAPQSLLGGILYGISYLYGLRVPEEKRRSTVNFWRIRGVPFFGCIVERVPFGLSGFSLGFFVVLPWRNSRAFTETLRHEAGHVVQSAILGPLYLPLAGLPSVYNNLRNRAGDLNVAEYYETYPERWADRLGAGRLK